MFLILGVAQNLCFKVFLILGVAQNLCFTIFVSLHSTVLYQPHTHTLDHSWMMFGSPISGNPHTDKQPSMDDGSIFQWFNPKCMTSWQELLGSGDSRSSFKNIQKHSRTTSKRLVQNTNHEMPKPSTGTAPYMKRHTAYQASTSPAISHPASRPMCNAWALPIAAACFFEPCGPCFGNVQRQLTGIILAAIESPRHVPVQAS